MLSRVSLTACQFVFWTHWGNDWMPKHSWRKTILLLSKLRLGMSGILELAGPDCLFENTLHDTFLDFVVWVSQKEWTWSMQRKKKRRSTCRIRRNNTAVSTGVLKARHLWTNGAFANTSSCAYKSKRAGWQLRKGFGGNIFVAHGWKIFAISVFSLTSSFPVFFFSEPWKIRRPLQLSLTPTLTLYTWISFHFFGGRQRSPLGLYHSLHNHLRHPDDRRPGKKGRRVDADLALGFSSVLRSKATASCRRLSSGRFRGVADFVHGKTDGMHVWSTASSSTFEAFPRTRAFVFTFAEAVLHSGQPGFQLLLVRSSFFVW